MKKHRKNNSQNKTKEIFDRVVENLQTIINNFKDYSFNNLILIFSQFPDATKVAR